ncbi:MAG: hypothetical protein ACRDZU_13525, partial [Acidimicrobiales bacterium]
MDRHQVAADGAPLALATAAGLEDVVVQVNATGRQVRLDRGATTAAATALLPLALLLALAGLVATTPAASPAAAAAALAALA